MAKKATNKKVSEVKETKNKVNETNEEVEVKVKKVDIDETENFLDDKKLTKKLNKEEKDGKSLFSRIMNVVLWIVLFIWMGVCLIDFYNVHQEKEPMFCIKTGTNEYEDGNVDWCLGAGYKIYHYNRKSFKAIEFGPFWSKDRTAEEEN